MRVFFFPLPFRTFARSMEWWSWMWMPMSPSLALGLGAGVMMMNQSTDGGLGLNDRRQPRSRFFSGLRGALFLRLAGGPAALGRFRLLAGGRGGGPDTTAACHFAPQRRGRGTCAPGRPGTSSNISSNMGLADHLKPKGRGGQTLFGDPIDLAKSSLGTTITTSRSPTLSSPSSRFLASPHVSRSLPPPALQRTAFEHRQASKHLRVSSPLPPFLSRLCFLSWVGCPAVALASWNLYQVSGCWGFFLFLAFAPPPPGGSWVSLHPAGSPLVRGSSPSRLLSSAVAA